MTIHERARAAWADIPVPDLTPSLRRRSQPERRVFVRDLLLEGLIGIYPHERIEPQKVLINMDLWVAETPGEPPKDYADVVCYEKLVNQAKILLAQGHIDLVETLAERLAELCLVDERFCAAGYVLKNPMPSPRRLA